MLIFTTGYLGHTSGMHGYGTELIYWEKEMLVF